MPLFKVIEPHKGTKIAIWKILESESFFLANLNLVEKEKVQLAKIKGNRRLQWLSARYCLNILLRRKTPVICIKDEYGKPKLSDNSFEISFSHSGDLSAVMISEQICGIDIQQVVEKIYRIKEKFLSERELRFIAKDDALAKLHIAWGAKESLYKAYGKKSVDFKSHIFLDEFSLKNSTYFKGRFKNDAFEKTFEIHAQKIENHYLVFACSL